MNNVHGSCQVVVTNKLSYDRMVNAKKDTKKTTCAVSHDDDSLVGIDILYSEFISNVLKRFWCLWVGNYCPYGCLHNALLRNTDNKIKKTKTEWKGNQQDTKYEFHIVFLWGSIFCFCVNEIYAFHYYLLLYSFSFAIPFFLFSFSTILFPRIKCQIVQRPVY